MVFRECSLWHGVASILDEGVFVCRHALDRLQLHHPGAGWSEALGLLRDSDEISAGLAAALLGRSLAGVQDRYFLAADRHGAFVVATSRPGRRLPWTMVTYLRFSPYQQAVAVRVVGAA